MQYKVCEELTRATSDRHAVLAGDEVKEFNSDLFIDEFDVILPDGTVIMCKAMVDQKSSFGLLQYVDATRNVSGEETQRVLEEH